MKKKKGFTLVELLAVIVILAIIALIAVPIIGKIISQAKEGAATSSAYGYIEGINDEIIVKGTFGTAVADGTYDVQDNDLGIQVKGKAPTAGTYTVTNMRVSYAEFCMNGKDVIYQNGKAELMENGSVCLNATLPAGGVYFKDLCLKENAPTYSDDVTYMIGKVEDLACLSLAYHSSAISGFSYQSRPNIVLVNNINMKSRNSYDLANADDYEMSYPVYADFNGDGSKDDLYTEFTTSRGFKPIGGMDDINHKFNGTFDGQGYTISNLYIRRNDLRDEEELEPGGTYVGLFSVLGANAVVKNLKISSAFIEGHANVGIIAGKNYGKIENFRVSGTARAIEDTGGANAGGAASVAGTNTETGLIQVGWINTTVESINMNENPGYKGDACGVACANDGVIRELVIETELYGASASGVAERSYKLASNTKVPEVRNILIRKVGVHSTGSNLEDYPVNSGAVVGYSDCFSESCSIIDGIVIESGTFSANNQTKPIGRYGGTNVYYFGAYYNGTAIEGQGTKIADTYKNDLTKYGEVLKVQSTTAEADDSGYYFGLNAAGKVDLIKR